MLNIELIFDASCPNVDATRINLERGLIQAGLTSNWKEWNRAAESAPSYVYGYGSPTILVNGLDIVTKQRPESVACCRLYEDDLGRLKGVPPVEVILEALMRAQDGDAQK